MPKVYMRGKKTVKPSARKYTVHMAVPEGCTDVWRINCITRKGAAIIHSNWRSRALCMEKADQLWLKSQDPRPEHDHVYVEHKAGIKIGEKWHIVNIPSFTFREDAIAGLPGSVRPQLGGDVTEIVEEDDDHGAF